MDVSFSKKYLSILNIGTGAFGARAHCDTALAPLTIEIMRPHAAPIQ
jgi:hypothetical protein